MFDVIWGNLQISGIKEDAESDQKLDLFDDKNVPRTKYQASGCHSMPLLVSIYICRDIVWILDSFVIRVDNE